MDEILKVRVGFEDGNLVYVWGRGKINVWPLYHITELIKDSFLNENRVTTIESKWVREEAISYQNELND